MFRLAWPVATAELGWMAMGVVDTMMVGRVSAEAIGAVSIGSHLFFAVAIFGIGMLLGLDYLVARAFGAGHMHDARRALVHGAYLSVALCRRADRRAVGDPAAPGGPRHSARVARETVPYLRALIWSLLPLLLYATLRRYLQALGLVRVVMVALVSANLINARSTGCSSSATSAFRRSAPRARAGRPSIARVYLFLYLLAYVGLARIPLPAPAWRCRGASTPQRLRELLRLGLPVGVADRRWRSGVFAAATVLAGRLSAAQLAAHQVALSAAAFDLHGAARHLVRRRRARRPGDGPDRPGRRGARGLDGAAAQRRRS